MKETLKKIEDIPKENREIERKFLLKKFPQNSLVTLASKGLKIFDIEQFYFKVDGKKKRFRVKTNDNDNKKTYYQTEKTMFGPGEFEEIEKVISEDEFFEVFNANKKKGSVITKDRFVVKMNGLDWEVDRYKNIDLVILEVELDDIKQEIKIPKFLKELIVMEVTGVKEFSNHSLSLKL